MGRPLLIDLFCGAGGASVGYHRAGFDVVGVDLEPMPNYPFPFHQADALDVLESIQNGGHWLHEIGEPDAIHASPPCQAHLKGLAAVNRKLGRDYDHPDLISQTRRLLHAAGVPYVIENVPGSPLQNPVRLCGSSFDLDVRRHRLFECSFALLVPGCDHARQRGDYWTSFRPNGKVIRSSVAQVYGQGADQHRWGEAMGIDWMTTHELREAIPPAYTEHVGAFLLDAVQSGRKATV